MQNKNCSSLKLDLPLFFITVLDILISAAIDSIMETPDPIPNSMVKLDSADGTTSVDVVGE